MDKRIPRLWYLPKGWGTVSERKPVKDYLKKPALLQKTISGPPDNCDWGQIEKSPYIFLVRSPLTFGHSQLVVPSPDDCDEEKVFQLASEIIHSAISTFRRAFGVEKSLHEKEVFKSLAENTLTFGSYKKTLVLRASAQEKRWEKYKKRGKEYAEYKVHLVPYFASHAALCKKRFQSLHKVEPHETGGLLGWLGEREDDVDKCETDPTCKKQLDCIANEDLRMPNLAKKLRDLWPS